MTKICESEEIEIAEMLGRQQAEQDRLRGESIVKEFTRLPIYEQLKTFEKIREVML